MSIIDTDGNLLIHIKALLIESQVEGIIVDTCAGNDKDRNLEGLNHLDTDLLDRMARQGFDRDSMDSVVCTHLRVDHVGWNTMLVDVLWIPTFPTSRYVIVGEEWEPWGNHGDQE
jgi:glyoxylase-like metal-dependent hydrolase (beta-lactamase superfamily II)